jgi:hypothetical protein
VEKFSTVRQATDDNIIRRMRFACWITKATDTHTEYVILIPFPRLQWLRERASVLPYAYDSSLVCFSVAKFCIVWTIFNLILYPSKERTFTLSEVSRNFLVSNQISYIPGFCVGDESAGIQS